MLFCKPLGIEMGVADENRKKFGKPSQVDRFSCFFAFLSLLKIYFQFFWSFSSCFGRLNIDLCGAQLLVRWRLSFRAFGPRINEWLPGQEDPLGTTWHISRELLWPKHQIEHDSPTWRESLFLDTLAAWIWEQLPFCFQPLARPN